MSGSVKKKLNDRASQDGYESIGHEISNSLSIALGSLSIIKEEMLQDQPAVEKILKRINTIHTSLVRVEKASKGLKGVGTEQFKERIFSLNSSVFEVIGLLEDIFWKENIELAAPRFDKEYFIKASPSCFQQVLINLANQIKEKIPSSSHQINFSFVQQDENINLKIGPYLGDCSELSFIKTLVAKMDGEISHTIDEQEIIVSLPLSKHKEIPAEEIQSAKDIREALANLKVLLIDDEEDILEIMEDLISEFGCYSEKATNGVEALRLIRKIDFDLILCDVKMPRLDGYELIEKVAARYKGKEMPKIVIVSAYSSDSDKVLDTHYESYILQYIDKPFTFEQISKVCHYVASNKSKKLAA